MTFDTRLKIALLAMRIGVFIVFLMWGLDKFLNPGHNSGMIGHYYPGAIAGIMQSTLPLLGALQLIMLGLFFLGFFKTITYGYFLLAHLGTTIVSAGRLFPRGGTWAGYELHQLLYFGSLPMLGCCIALFLVRERDTLLSPGSNFKLGKSK